MTNANFDALLAALADRVSPENSDTSDSDALDVALDAYGVE